MSNLLLNHPQKGDLKKPSEKNGRFFYWLNKMKTERIKVSPDGDQQGFCVRAVPCTGARAGQNHAKRFSACAAK